MDMKACWQTEGALQQIGTKEDSMARRTDSFFRGVGSQTGERPETEHALAEDWRPAPAEDHPSGPSSPLDPELL